MSSETLPAIYLAIFLVLLGVAAWFVIREVLKTRKVETAFTRLQRKLTQETGTAQEYYELAGILLDKRLYTQAIPQLQKALKLENSEAPEDLALIYNALGFAYAAQEQYDLAIRNYKEALKLQPGYVTALNNLGFAYERKKLTIQALETYEQALKLEPKNDNAKRRATSLRKLVTPA
jgi:tetratricopeptide (TPR) repeat protein